MADTQTNGTETKGTELRQRRESGIVPFVSTRSEVAVEDLPQSEQTLAKVRRGEFTSEQIKDPFASFAGQASTSKITEVRPPFNMASLLKMAVDNSVLKQCIEAMVTNISGHGYRLEYIGEEGQSETQEAVKEAEHIHEFMAHPNEDYSMTELKKRVRWDLEATGNGYIEVARNNKGQVTAAWHLPAHLMLMTECDKEPTPVTIEVPRFGEKAQKRVNKYFRRFVQARGTKKVYFKEWGDPRSINPKDGSVDAVIPHEDAATEIYHMNLYHAGYAYGIPRWINNLIAIQGSRQAELTNLDFFAENAIPAMMIMVSGGVLSQSTINNLESHIAGLRGRRAANRVVFIEAFGDEQAKGEDGSIPAPKLDVKPMGGERPKEGMFLDYDKQQTDKVRSSFRLPPIFLGLSQDYTHATANTSYEVGEGQVFGPERVTEDDVTNNKFLSGYDLKYWEVRSNPPRITDPKEILEAVKAFDETGAMTPNTAIGIANELFDLQADMIEDTWGDLPFKTVEVLIGNGNLILNEEGSIVWSEKPEAPTLSTASPVGGSGAPQNEGGDTDQKSEPDDVNKLTRHAMLVLRRNLLAQNADQEAMAANNDQVRSRTRVPHPDA